VRESLKQLFACDLVCAQPAWNGVASALLVEAPTPVILLRPTSIALTSSGSAGSAARGRGQRFRPERQHLRAVMRAESRIAY
jgi:hypothetical protein